MLEEIITGIDEENHQVTTIISHNVRPGREQGYEEWVHGITAAAIKFKGYMGISVIRPWDHSHPEHVAIVRFDRYHNLKKWLESDVRQEWIERLQPLIEEPETIQIMTGLETWFTLTSKPMKSIPPRYKMALVSWLGVFLTLPLLNHFLAPLLSSLPVILGQLIGTGIGVALLTYLIMPRLTQLFCSWLYPNS